MVTLLDFLQWVQRGLQRIGRGVTLRFRREPVLTAALLRACVVMGTAFVFTWTETQIVAAYAFIEAITAYISRQSVTPVDV